MFHLELITLIYLRKLGKTRQRPKKNNTETSQPAVHLRNRRVGKRQLRLHTLIAQ